MPLPVTLELTSKSFHRRWSNLPVISLFPGDGGSPDAKWSAGKKRNPALAVLFDTSTDYCLFWFTGKYKSEQVRNIA